jgi:adenylate cyclase
VKRGLLIGALCAALVCAASRMAFEWPLNDAFTRAIAARTPPDPRIVIVGVDETTLHNLDLLGYGRPPYSREVYARAIEELHRAGARVIAIDIAFAEENLADPAGDRRFAAALHDAPVVLAAQTRSIPSPIGIDRSRLWRISDAPPTDRAGLVEPLALFRDAAGIGTVRLTETETQNIHTSRLVERVFGDHFAGSLALEAVRAFLGAPRAVKLTADSFTFAGRRIQLDEQLNAIVRWHGRQTERVRYTYVGFDKLLLSALAEEDPTAVPARDRAMFQAKLKDKIVLIGYTAVGLVDLRVTPLSPRTAGVEIHANVADDLLNNSFNRYANVPATFAAIFAIAALIGACIGATRSQFLSALIALAGVGGWAGATFVALQHGVVIRGVAGMTSIALTWIAITAVEFAAEQRQTAQLRATFGRYVSPQILEHILAHPEKVQLGGERRDLTILFSDIRGFTSISEASEPEQVVEMLNEYLTRMVEILLAHGGTLDKFIGDAVMGFWNAPAAEPNHARRSVECAIEMIDETARLRARWETEGKASIRIGIGINTGEAVAGNIGAEQVFGYTVIGDAVNLASRLESKNKDYATEIIISEFTLARIGEGFDTVYLDEVKVKGKERAVKIYEVRGQKK